MRYPETPTSLRCIPPGLGEQTDEIIRQLGYSDDKIPALRSEAVVSADRGPSRTANGRPGHGRRIFGTEPPVLRPESSPTVQTIVYSQAQPGQTVMEPGVAVVPKGPPSPSEPA